jgi:hypothetical protein
MVKAEEWAAEFCYSELLYGTERRWPARRSHFEREGLPS